MCVCDAQYWTSGHNTKQMRRIRDRSVRALAGVLIASISEAIRNVWYVPGDFVRILEGLWSREWKVAVWGRHM
jgi:hypothetical protein